MAPKKSSSGSTNRPRKFRPPTPEKDKPKRQAIVINLEADVHQRLKRACERHGVTMQDTVVEMVGHCLPDMEE